MKKYEKPQTQVHDVSPSSMICGSVDETGLGNGYRPVKNFFSDEDDTLDDLLWIELLK